MEIGESNTEGPRNSVVDLPNGFYVTDTNFFEWDDADLLGSGQAFRVLKAPSWSTVAITIASPGVVTWTANGLANGDPIVLTTTGALPTGLTAGTRYYVVNQATNTFQLAATRGGAAINTSGTQSGTHTAAANGGHEQQPGGAAYVDTAYMATIGNGMEFIKRYRQRNPSKPLYKFDSQQGGGRFSDLASRGRAANYKYNLTDGAYNEAKVSYLAAKAALVAAGSTPNIIGVRINLGANTAGDDTEISTFVTDMTNLIAQGRTDMWGSAQVIVDRVGQQQSASWTQTRFDNIRAAAISLVSGDPSLQMLDLDGIPVNTSIDNVHFTAGGQALIGKRLDWLTAGLWFPTKPIKELNAPAIYPLRQWEFNGPLSTLVSGAISNVPDQVDGAAAMAQASASVRPAAASRTLANGLTARYGTWDGVDDHFASGSPIAINNPGGFILGVVIKIPAAVNNGVIYSEAHDSNGTPFWGWKLNASGAPCITLRDDANVVQLSLADLGLGNVATNAWVRLILTYSGTVFTGYKDGVVGSSPQNYTKTAMTLNNASIGAQKVGGTPGGFVAFSAAEVVIMQYSATGLSTLITNLDGYLSREYI